MGQVQPDGPIDDYFPDYQFGCGWSYSSMTVVHRKAVSAAFFVAFCSSPIHTHGVYC
jgi:hypothetical protein